VGVDVDEETVRVAWLEELGSELIELPRPAPVAEVREHSREDGVAARGILGMCVRDQARDLHRQRSRLLASTEPGERARFLQAVLRPLEGIGACLQEGPAFLEQVEGVLGVAPVELEMSQQLMCPRRAICVLRQAEDLERATGESRRSDGVTTLSVEPGLRPVELGADTRALEAAAERERGAEELLGATEVPAVDQCVREEH
jgi:hypothetical protein